VKYSFVAQNENTFSVRLICEVLGASRNGYYNYKKSTASKVDPKRERLRDLVVTISKANDRTYGSRRIKHARRARG
jgi:hypothetical protein